MSNLTTSYEAGAMMTLSLHVGKLRHREVWPPTQSHATSEWYSCDLELGFFQNLYSYKPVIVCKARCMVGVQ